MVGRTRLRLDPVGSSPAFPVSSEGHTGPTSALGFKDSGPFGHFTKPLSVTQRELKTSGKARQVMLICAFLFFYIILGNVVKTETLTKLSTEKHVFTQIYSQILQLTPANSPSKRCP